MRANAPFVLMPQNGALIRRKTAVYSKSVVIDLKSINKITFKSIYHAIMAKRKNQSELLSCDDADSDGIIILQFVEL